MTEQRFVSHFKTSTPNVPKKEKGSFEKCFKKRSGGKKKSGELRPFNVSLSLEPLRFQELTGLGPLVGVAAHGFEQQLIETSRRDFHISTWRKKNTKLNNW